MMRFRAYLAIVAGAATLLMPMARDAAADDDFFKGKDITLYVGSTSGGPYDAYARMLARHWGRHIPGNPNFVVQNMPGASGRRLMGHMQGVAPKDGTAIAAAHRALPFDPLMGVKSKFDPTKVTWLGNANDEVNICIVWHASPIKTFADLRQREMVVGSGGSASTDTIYPHVMNALFGTKFRVVHGYEAAAQTHIAMERGEVDGRCGMTWDTLQAIKPDWITGKKVRILVQFALEKHPDLPDVPSVFDFARNEEERQILALWSAPNKMGRPFYAPIELPKDRAELLRRSFDRTLKDPALLAEVKKTKLFVSPTTGEDIDALIKRIYATPKDVVAKALEASKGGK
jgi:tripartite-type tricarboxylate transporter receptor subunit TctC